ncbi:MAG: small subunit ribosomal protein [Candidatus Diapherotrites archaeon]|nr:small subunit ribosomal protein [Candidatus Diapherotrites archaeon]MDN5366936.1 small subunit ribosomal protein [Candidatus Diapherotrites archaeon]NPA77193.1 30S ribosomal protein S14 [Candidatus Diapherotrites archaeon]
MGKRRPRARHGKNVKCQRCGRPEAVIRKYGLMLCRQCFREVARELGFEKYS